MIDSQILVNLDAFKERRPQNPNQYQEWVARFCYAAAKMPPATVEQILSLMETASESDQEEHHQ